MAFNLLVVFLPLAAILYLDVYEKRLESAQERAMAAQAEVLASVLTAGEGLSPARVQEIVEHLGATEPRLRVVDSGGELLADTSRAISSDAIPGSTAGARRSILYRIGVLLFRRPFRLIRPPDPVPVATGTTTKAFSELVGRTLGGEEVIDKRITTEPSSSVILYATAPVVRDRHVVGAVVASQSTYRILADLYVIRLGIFRIFLASVAAAIVISLWIAATIVRPIRRLRVEAGSILDARGRLTRSMRGSTKNDEIGELSRALERLTSRLDEHQRSAESFASDVSHELKNPLASIRTATEMLATVDEPGQRDRFVTIIEKEVARMEDLLSGLRDVSLIDGRLATEEREKIDVARLADEIVEGFRLREGGRVALEVRGTDEPILVEASKDRLIQVIENVLDNAVSFSPPGGRVAIEMSDGGDAVWIRVSDVGPGIPPNDFDRIFERFFSYRPEKDGERTHTGLGLAIVKAIVDGYGGSISARNQPAGGAMFEIRLPRA